MARAKGELVPAPLSDPLRLGLPLSDHQVEQLREIEQASGARPGWGRDGRGLFFVDVLVDQEEVRYRGETLHLALGAALRAARGGG